MPRCGTLTLGGPPLACLPGQRGDRVPRSTPQPASRSRPLYAGRHAGRKPVPPALLLEERLAPVLTSSLRFRHLIDGALALVSVLPPCHDHAVPFPHRSRPWLFTSAAGGGLQPPPARRLRGACPHRVCRMAASECLRPTHSFVPSWRTVIGVSDIAQFRLMACIIHGRLSHFLFQLFELF